MNYIFVLVDCCCYILMKSAAYEKSKYYLLSQCTGLGFVRRMVYNNSFIYYYVFNLYRAGRRADLIYIIWFLFVFVWFSVFFSFFSTTTSNQLEWMKRKIMCLSLCLDACLLLLLSSHTYTHTCCFDVRYACIIICHGVVHVSNGKDAQKPASLRTERVSGVGSKDQRASAYYALNGTCGIDRNLLRERST